MLTHPILEQLHQLRLNGMHKALAEQLQMNDLERLDFEERLGLLIDRETTERADRRLVFISRYDGDNADTDDNPFTGTEADLLWLRVEIEGTASALQALKVDQ